MHALGAYIVYTQLLLGSNGLLSNNETIRFDIIFNVRSTMGASSLQMAWGEQILIRLFDREDRH